MKSFELLIWMVVGGAMLPARADFVAYNDHESGPGTHLNTTLYGANGRASGPLKDIQSGEELAVTLSTSAVGVAYSFQTGVPSPGTDGGAVFEGFVDFSTGHPHSIELSGSDSYAHEFTGLDPSRRYDFTGLAVRGRSGYVDRWTLVTLEGAESFTPSHSEGIGLVTEGLGDSRAALWTGENHQADQGLVVRWSDIDPGPDGAFRIVSQQYRGPTPGVGSGDSTAGSKGYALTGVRLMELVIEGRPEVVNLPASDLGSRSARVGGRVVDPGVDTPSVSVYYGPRDGGKTAAKWAYSVDLGLRDASFDVPISELEPGTGYFFRCYAVNRVAGAWAESSQSFSTRPVPPEIVDGGVEERMALGATLSGRVVATGGDTPRITLFRGRTDGGEEPAAWAASLDLGQRDGAFNARLNGLEPETSYVYRFRAENSAAAVWTEPAGRFETLPLGRPAIALNPVQSVSDRSAVVTGAVTDTGGDPPRVDLFVGTTDGGLTPDAWDRSVSLGVHPGAFQTSIGSLQPLTGYHLRARAVNAAGEAWSDPTPGFETLETLEVSIVINEIHYHTREKTSRSEFIELYNASEAGIDLSGWRLRGGVDYVFPAGARLAPGEYLVIAEDLEGFHAAFGDNPFGQWQEGGKLSNEGGRIELEDSTGRRIDRVGYGNGFPWPNRANGEGPSMELVHPLLDNDLGGSWRGSDGEPTAGRVNSVFSEQLPPHLRQVKHTPKQPRSGEDVLVTVKVTDPDGLVAVTLSYQYVEPGDYISLNDGRYSRGWSEIPMRDDGQHGDALGGDSIYTAVLPGAGQLHRRLVRYRIDAEDTLGNAIRAPYAGDPQPNFAFFVYDGVPAWTGSARPGVAPAETFDSELLTRVPVYHLITTRKSHEEAMSIPNSRAGEYWGGDYPWMGALVYDGDVYDHIRFRARGGVWRYSMGKNMWKFDFNRSHDFQARDDYGRSYRTKWKKLNFSALIQQGNFRQRGEQGLFEGAGFKLHNLADNPAPYTHYVHFRIVEHGDENGPTASQFDTDFRGLYLVIEQPDGRLLDEHGLPDGNFYKMEGGTGDLNNQGSTQPTNKSDLNEFLVYKNVSRFVSWWESMLDLDQYYSFRAILLAIHDYDCHAGKNYFYYHNPQTDIWSVINWDLDLCWTTTYNGGGGRGPLDQHVLNHSRFEIAYRNRLRELRDLLFNPEQTGMLLDEIARVVYTPGELSLVDADRAMWDYNPILTSSYINSGKAGQGKFYEAASSRDFGAMLRKQKQYVSSRGDWLDRNELTDDRLAPGRPVATPLNDGFPIDDLTFETSSFTSSNGQAFAAMQWRIAEVTDPAEGDLVASSEPARYEIRELWTSGSLLQFESRVTIPVDTVKVGSLYRVRVRMQDQAGRWSHWSEPVQFTSGEPTGWERLKNDLLIAEIMYHPPTPTTEELAAGFSESDFEFVELYNRGPQPLDLTQVRFTKGIDFDFSGGNILSLQPEDYLLVVRRRAAFEFRYGSGFPIAGEYLDPEAEDELSNGGERVKLAYGAGNTLTDFEYDDAAPWPWQADGQGYSLTLKLPSGEVDYGDPAAWKASRVSGGTPGGPDGSPYQAWKAAFFSPEELLDPEISGDGADPDGDGGSNLDEFRAGTDPRDALSALRLEAPVGPGPEGFRIRWSVVAGKHYRVQYRESLLDGEWLDLRGGAWTAPSSGYAEVVDPEPSPLAQRFYRILLPE